ncbi:hypothetical protein [Oryzomonas rubra]|uniref:Asparagine synthase n=1 Tax=Oryzomonas rubra TaxID=2509454 RepID=A0A5A9XPW6_9BACT|nr:hypothetical protein [Oryzomonas rubra]KAA0894079.1 hypothetical protein ET418_03710 [Oryzomonas rubra]
MARWYLTSNENSHQQAENACRRAGLNSSGHRSTHNCHVQAYLKRAVGTNNLVTCGEDDWICSAGTIIYRSRLGPSALRDFYSDFVNSGIEAVRSRAIGHYAVAIRHNNKITVFTDPQGAISLYYSNMDSCWNISNSLDICAQMLPERRINPIKLVMTAFESCTLGEETFYRGVRRLFGTQAITVDLNDGVFKVNNLPDTHTARQKYSSISDAVDGYKSEVQAVFREITAVGSVGLFGTGGRDSRTILAALLDQGAAPKIMYGVGNSDLTDDRPIDLEIATKIAETFNLPFQLLDWSGEQPYNQNILQELFQTYGFQYEVYGASRSLLEELSGGISPYPDLLLGGRGVITACRRPWAQEHRNYTINDLIEFNMSSEGKSPDLPCRELYRSEFIQDLREGLRHGGIEFPDDEAPLETFVKAALFLYIRTDARFLNFANEFCHYIDPLALKCLHDSLLEMPFEYRSNDAFQIRLIHTLMPELLELPVCTTHRPAKINLKTFELEFLDVYKQAFLSRLAHAVLPSACIEPAKKLYHFAKGGKKRESAILPDDRKLKSNQIMETYGRQVLSDPLSTHYLTTTTFLKIKAAERFAHYLAGVNALGYLE